MLTSDTAGAGTAGGTADISCVIDPVSNGNRSHWNTFCLCPFIDRPFTQLRPIVY